MITVFEPSVKKPSILVLLFDASHDTVNDQIIIATIYQVD
jgi:hypothetical protein